MQKGWYLWLGYWLLKTIVTFKRFCEHFLLRSMRWFKPFQELKASCFWPRWDWPRFARYHASREKWGSGLKAIREQSQIPVIMLTALSDKKLISQYLLDGANDYIVKPFDLDEVFARVTVQLRQSVEKQPTEIEKLKICHKTWKISSLMQKVLKLKIARKRFALPRKNAWFSKLSLNTLRKFLPRKNFMNWSGRIATYLEIIPSIRIWVIFVKIKPAWPKSRIYWNHLGSWGKIKRRQAMTYIIIFVLLVLLIILSIALIRYHLALKNLSQQIEDKILTGSMKRVGVSIFPKIFTSLPTDWKFVSGSRAISIGDEKEKQTLDMAISNIAHDIRTPLTIASGYTQQLIKSPEDKSETLQK